MDTSSPQGLDFPAGWEYELFTVVDAGNGEVAFHNPRWNRFVWMEGPPGAQRMGTVEGII